MDVRLALVAYLFPGLGIIFGTPLALGMVPPNRFYGYRTRKTFSSTEIWYRANRFCGWAMVISGLVALFYNLYSLRAHAGWPSATQQLAVTIATAILLLLGLFISSLYVRKL